MARLRTKERPPGVFRPALEEEDQTAARRTRQRAAKTPSILIARDSSPDVSKVASNMRQKNATKEKNIETAGLPQRNCLAGSKQRNPPAPRMQRALKPLAHDKSLFRPVAEIEPRRTKKTSVVSVKRVDKENQSVGQPETKPQGTKSRLTHIQDDHPVVEEEISVMEDSEEEWNACESDAETVQSSDDEDDMPIKPTRASRSPNKDIARRLQVLDLTDSERENPSINKTNRRLSSSSTEDPSATLHFSPPSRSPHPSKLVSRPVTPPASPSKSKLVSPSKTVKHIPTLPGHRSSLDAFWSADEVNNWNDQYSPKKVLKSPRKNPLLLFAQPNLGLPPSLSFSDSEEEEEYVPKHKTGATAQPSPNKAASKRSSPKKHDALDPEAEIRAANRAQTASRKAFDAIKHSLATSFLADLDSTISNGEVSRLTASTGGIAIVWSKKLTSTAGRAHWRREAIRASTEATANEPAPTHRHVASIEIATKVIDNAERLRNVLAHEYCHLANFMISRVTAEPHGASFKAWARKATAAFAHVGVEVTTKHSYEISYKYAWVCAGRQGPGSLSIEDEGCGTTYQRHSKSIDTTRQGCGKCRGRLVQIRPVPRAGAAVALQNSNAGDAKGVSLQLPSKNSMTTGKTKSGYQAFVSEQYKLVKAELGATSPMKEVMGEIGRRYRALKDEKAADSSTTEVINLEGEPDKARSGEDIDAVARKLDFLDLGL